MQRGACGEDEPVARLVDQPDATEPHEGIVRVFRRDVFAGAVADKLIDRPRPLVVGVEEPVHDAPIVHVLGFYGWVRLLLHRKVPPFGATPPAVSAVRGHFDREAATVSASRPSVNEFRYTFRQTLLEMGTRASSKVRAKTRPTPAQPEAKFDADTDSLPPPIAAGLVFIASGAVLVLEILAGGSTADQARLIGGPTADCRPGRRPRSRDMRISGRTETPGQIHRLGDADARPRHDYRLSWLRD
jgi:hypothetical protein